MGQPCQDQANRDPADVNASRPRDERFPARCRLRRQRDFDRVYKARCSVSGDWLVLYAVANGLPHSRLGLSVGRRVGSAVARNRWKRWVREAFRRQRPELPEGFDFVVVVRRPKQADVPEPTGASVFALLRQLAWSAARRWERRR